MKSTLILFATFSMIGCSNGTASSISETPSDEAGSTEMNSEECRSIYSQADDHIDTRTVRIWIDDVESDTGTLTPVVAKQSVAEALKKGGCSGYQPTFTEAVCKEIMPGNSWSTTCYLENEMGFYFVSYDMVDGINVTWNRWD